MRLTAKASTICSLGLALGFLFLGACRARDQNSAAAGAPPQLAGVYKEAGTYDLNAKISASAPEGEDTLSIGYVDRNGEQRYLHQANPAFPSSWFWQLQDAYRTLPREQAIKATAIVTFNSNNNVIAIATSWGLKLALRYPDRLPAREGAYREMPAQDWEAISGAPYYFPNSGVTGAPPPAAGSSKKADNYTLNARISATAPEGEDTLSIGYVDRNGEQRYLHQYNPAFPSSWYWQLQDAYRDLPREQAAAATAVVTFNANNNVVAIATSWGLELALRHPEKLPAREGAFKDLSAQEWEAISGTPYYFPR